MTRRPHPGLAAALLPAALLLAGCAVGPDFQRPAAPQVDGYTPEKPADPAATAGTRAGAAQRFAVGQDIQGEWWTLFHSAPLDRLMQRALKANPDVEAAQAALRQARENAYAQQGALFPAASASFQPQRERLSGAEFGAPKQSPTFSLVTAQLSVSYAPDVFGGTRRKIESLQAQADYQRFELEATYLTLTANLVVAAIDEASLRGQIAATEQIIKAEADQLDGGAPAGPRRRGLARRPAGAAGDAGAIARDAAAAAQAACAAARPAYRAGRAASPARSSMPASNLPT